MWLSATWEASWPPFSYFNLYRLLLASLLLLLTLFFEGGLINAQLGHFHSVPWGIAAYILFVAAGWAASRHWRQRFNLQLSLQVLGDVVATSLLMWIGGGVGSGFGMLLIVSLATASLVGQGRLVLFYAAISTLTTLLVQAGLVFRELQDPGSLVQAGLLSAGFFATAILARLLGQRVMVNEDLAKQRGVSLENQSRISQRIIERMLDGILVVDSAGKILRHNPVARSMLHLEDADSRTLDKCCVQLNDAMIVWRAGREATADLVTENGDEVRVRFEETASTTGEVLVFLEDLRRLKAQAQQIKLAALGRLTASIAHEIRNPLSAIGHAGELLKEERRGAMQDRLLKILADNVARLDRIVGDVLELGRRDRIQMEKLPLAAFCKQFADGFEAAEQLPSGVLVINIDPALTIRFDRTHLNQVLWNIVGNGVRYSSGKSGCVLINACLRTDGEIELHIVDDGVGVPEAIRNQIFEPFFTTYHQGTGLGLFIARELCEANGASLELVSDAKGGHFILVGKGD